MMISRDGNDHVGHVRLEPLAPDRTLIHFDEEADLDPEVYTFIIRHNEAHLQAESDYLTADPDYRPDLA
jgi:hypothetical protein